MSESLPVRSFEVEGFRAIRHLRLPDLNRVNLFVGKNNAGKTSLLEALRLYTSRNTRALEAVTVEIVRAHADFRSLALFVGEAEPNRTDLQVALEAVEALFYGGFDDDYVRLIRLTGQPDSHATLTIDLPWSASTDVSRDEAVGTPLLIDPRGDALRLHSEQRRTAIPIEWVIRRIVLLSPEQSPSVLVPSSGIQPFDTRVMWDNLVVSGQEAAVEDALRIIIPDLERIILVGEQRSRSVLCKLKSHRKPVPIIAMGDGANRVFGLAVALGQARGGVLLIDEIENGLHHSVQADVWDVIFSLSIALDVQVFATTHSWDAVVGFQNAANRSAAGGALYRLEREEDGSVYVEMYTQEEVAIAAEQQVEVR
jgi:hypothetical protein